MPDPTSIELMHRFVRAAFLKRLERNGLGHLASSSSKPPSELEGGTPSALDIYLAAVATQARRSTSCAKQSSASRRTS